MSSKKQKYIVVSSEHPEFKIPLFAPSKRLKAVKNRMDLPKRGGIRDEIEV